MLTVTTPANNYDLTLLATVKAQLGITDRSEDENLARWISEASGEVSKRLNRVFAKETVSETLRFTSRHHGILLSRFPVCEIVSVVENDAALAETDYEINPETGELNRLRNDCIWHWPVGKIVIAYTAGYAAVRDLPDGVERLTLIFVNQFRYAATRDPLLRSETTEGAGSSSYFDAGSSPEAENLISRLRKPANG
jgi:Phage gp6-like head-tail connector protein